MAEIQLFDPETDNAVIASAAVITAPGQAEVWQQVVPQPGPGQVRVRLEGSGVCASNLPVWQGRDWFTYPQEPGAPGHEGWGIVDAVGPGVTHLQPGQRVATLSSHAYAEYDLADAAATVPLPPELKDQPFPAEPLGCAINIFRRSGVTSGSRVAIVGIGFLGALLVQLCRDAGAEVTALSRRASALGTARTTGAHNAITLDDHWQVIERAREQTNGRMFDVVIECVGMQWPLDLAGELVRERGRLVVAGYHQDGLRQVNMQQWNWKGLDVINAHERDPAVYRSGMEEAIIAVISGRIDPTPLYTHKLTLGQLSEAFRLMEERPDGFFKALLTY